MLFVFLSRYSYTKYSFLGSKMHVIYTIKEMIVIYFLSSHCDNHY